MQKEKNSSLNGMSYKEELALFYDKYLNLANGFGENYLNELMVKYLHVWEQFIKTLGVEDLQEGERILIPALKEEDLKDFSSQELEFLNFQTKTVINFNEDYNLVVDAYGMIEGFDYKRPMDTTEQMLLNKNVGSNVFTFLKTIPSSYESDLAQEQAENIILQNVLVSKIHKAMFAEIKNAYGPLKAAFFAAWTTKMINYDDTITALVDYENIFTRRIPTRSLR